MTAVRGQEFTDYGDDGESLRDHLRACEARNDYQQMAPSAGMPDTEYQLHLDVMEEIRAWIRHLEPAEAFRLVREVIDNAAPEPHVILLSLTPDELLWLADKHMPPPD